MDNKQVQGEEWQGKSFVAGAAAGVSSVMCG